MAKLNGKELQLHGIHHLLSLPVLHTRKMEVEITLIH